MAEAVQEHQEGYFEEAEGVDMIFSGAIHLQAFLCRNFDDRGFLKEKKYSTHFSHIVMHLFFMYKIG